MGKRTSEPLREEDKRALNVKNLKNIAGIFKYAMPYKWPFIGGLVALFLSSLTTLSFPYFAGLLLDIASKQQVKYFTSINQVALTLLGILIIQSIVSFVRVYAFVIANEKTLADIRQAVYKKMIWSPLSFFDSRRVGELMSRITSDVAQLQDTFTITVAELLRQISILVIGTSIILYLAWELTIFMLLTFPILVVLALIFGKYIRKMSRKTQDKLAEANVVVEESLQSIAVVKAFTNEVLEIFRYKSKLNEVVGIALRTARFRGLFISFVILALFGGIVAIGWKGALLVESGVLTPGKLFSFVFYTGFIGASIAGLGDIYATLQRAIGASERLLEILQQPDELDSSSEKAIKFNGEIAFNNVSFTYPSRADFPVLKELTFNIAAGEKIALIGQSGSGKSTIINLLMRFYPVHQGDIQVDGASIQDYHLTAYRHNIGIVPQEVILFGGTIQENIAYGKPNATFDEIKEASRKANALEFIESFPDGFQTVVGERGVKLSGGQRQRVAIARAILKDPAILILDEATSSLDVKSELLVQQALEKLMEGRTSIVIAHRLSTIKKVDRIFVINEGRLAEMGSHTELTRLNNGIYSTLLKLQVHEE